MAVNQLGDGAVYVEGWIVTDHAHPFVIEHGWCEVDGRIVDPSYTPYVSTCPPPVAYYPGMRFSARKAGAALVDQTLPLAWRRHDATYQRAFEAAFRHVLRQQQREPRPPTRIVHCRRDVCDVFIGRPSKWAVPLHLERDSTEQQVIAKYRHWIMRQPGLLRDVATLRGKVLGCTCAPFPCHGDMLVELADFGREAEEGVGAEAHRGALPQSSVQPAIPELLDGEAIDRIRRDEPLAPLVLSLRSLVQAAQRLAHAVGARRH